MTLGELLNSFALKPDLQLKKPSIRAEGKTLYMQSPPSIEEQTRPNLDKTLKEELGLDVGHEIAVTDPAFPSLSFRFIIRFI
jgi:ubiquitin-activating enzyme E1 C